MGQQRTQEESIAFLLSQGMSEEEIAQLAAQEAAHQARRKVRAQQQPGPAKRERKPTSAPAAPASPLSQPLAYVPPGPCTTKERYKVSNWSAYNQALVQRGSLTIWLSEDVLAAWCTSERGSEAGRPKLYSELAIVCVLTLQQVYRLKLRQTEGFVRSLMELAKVELPVPDYSTLCRRRRTVEVALPQLRREEGMHLLVDSTGVKIFGEGEWKARQHGVQRRRTWRKLHLGFDEATQEIVACVVTTNELHDAELLGALLEQVEGPLEQVTADGAYDTQNCYRAIVEREAKPVIPPRENAVLNEGEQWAARNQTLSRISEIGRAGWKEESGYRRRSLAETGMFRLKTVFGDRLGARTLAGQTAEALLRCAALNRMSQLGRPQSLPASAG